VNPALRSGFIVIATVVTLAGMSAAGEPDVIQGSPILTVLPVDAIRAIDNPRYVSVAEADRFMRPDEPVLGITDGKVAKAYSTWQLNHHEIVNDGLGELPLAVTW
jgi:Protein of unknown function (DUF3179)